MLTLDSPLPAAPGRMSVGHCILTVMDDDRTVPWRGDPVDEDGALAHKVEKQRTSNPAWVAAAHAAILGRALTASRVAEAMTKEAERSRPQITP